MEGRILAARYRLISCLGQGGMGSVWRAEHVELGTPTAVKLIDPEISDSQEVLIRFKREAQAAAMLRSPHIVQIFDYGVDEGTPYIAMELLEGESLGDRLERERVLNPMLAATILQQVARGIGKAHENGIVHRDLKPDNLFLCPNDDGVLVKILDFGIAKSASSALKNTSGMRTRTGAILGTPYYMSPEQASGRRAIDHRTDLWALAAIIYECIVGQRAFVDENLGGLLLAICSEPAPVPSSRALVPLGFDEWFARGVAKDPEQRFHSAREMAAELAALVGLPVPSTGSAWVSQPQSSAALPSGPNAPPGQATISTNGAHPPVPTPFDPYAPSAREMAWTNPAQTGGTTAEHAPPASVTLSSPPGKKSALALPLTLAGLFLVGLAIGAVWLLQSPAPPGAESPVTAGGPPPAAAPPPGPVLTAPASTDRGSLEEPRLPATVDAGAATEQPDQRAAPELAAKKRTRPAAPSPRPQPRPRPTAAPATDKPAAPSPTPPPSTPQPTPNTGSRLDSDLGI